MTCSTYGTVPWQTFVNIVTQKQSNRQTIATISNQMPIAIDII
ncbi:hypothetical protein FPS14_contig00129-0001 [Flavobacterium psychrophilum]|nr:hypothetical protein FPS14_contig00129-0001 [Flavobacterium psychrophilum]